MTVFSKNGELSPDAIDVLYEIGNMGVGTAVMAIGNLREMEIRVSIPTVVAVEKDIFSEIGCNPYQLVVGVETKMDNTLQGTILFLLSSEFVRNTVCKMTGELYDNWQFLTDADCLSAIDEIINYMTAGYAKVIGAVLDTPVFISSPSVGFDKAENIITRILDNTPAEVDKIACVKTKFTIVDAQGSKTDEEGQVLIFPDENSIKQFIEIMK